MEEVVYSLTGCFGTPINNMEVIFIMQVQKMKSNYILQCLSSGGRV